MTCRTLFLNILMSIFCCVFSPTIMAGQNKMGMPQMQDFEKELEEANRAIEEYVGSLPPAEQAEFNRQVEEMSRMFENMSEEEFESFLGEMFTDEPIMEPNPFEVTQPTAPEVVEVVLSDEDKKKVETAIKVLDDIAKQSNLFSVIINSSPDLPNRINRWGNKGTISNWQAGLDWNKFKIELEALIQKTYKAQERDLTTNKYKYLLELIADEALYNNLIQLKTALNSLVPVINLPEFSIQKLSNQSKETIKNILQKYTEAFYLLTIPKALDTLFEKYAPEEEKIRAAEEAANKRALDASRGVRTPAAQSEPAGVESGSMGYDYGYGSNYYGGDYGYNPYDSYGSYGNNYGYSPDYDSHGYDSGSTGGKSSGGAGGAGGGSGASGPKTIENEKDQDKNIKEQIKFIPDHETERAIADIKTGLNDIKAAMIEETDDKEEKPSVLAHLADAITKDKDVNVILAGSTIPKIVNTKIDLIDKAVETINKKTFNEQDLAHYKRELNKVFDKNKKTLELLKKEINKFGTAEEVETEEKEAKKTPALKVEKSKPKINITKLSKAQQWAYFGGKEEDLDTDDATEKLKTDIGTPVSLFSIRDKINKLFDDVKKFSTKKSAIPVEKKKKETPVVASE